MAGSDVSYETAPTVAPSTSGGPSMLSVRADSHDFGGQVGQALEGVGGQLTQTQGEAFAYAAKRQGMVNESLATNAETEYETGKARILNDYRSKEGLTAVAAQQKAEADLVALREQIAGKLPNDFAQKSFRTLTNKSQAYGISDIGTYASGQVKKADTDSATASANNAVAASNSYPVASDDDRFGDTLHTIKFQTARQVVNQGYGPEGGTGMTQDAATGDVSFDETRPQGQAAKAVYQNQLDKASGMAWENRIKTLADDPTNGNITRALKVFNDNRDSIPAETQAKLSAYLTPKVRSVQSLGLAQTQLSYAEHGYQSSVGQAGTGDIHQAILGQESGGNDNVQPSAKGAIGPMQIEPATFQRFAQPGEVITNPADNRKVGQRYIDYLSKLPNVQGDPARIAVGYFSGEGNIAPAGSQTPWIKDSNDGKVSVSQYVSGVLKRTGGGPQSDPSALAKAGPSQFQSRADYYNANYDTIVQNTRADAQRLHPDDPQFEEQSVAHVEQQMRSVMHTQASLNKSNADIVYQALGGAFTNGTRPSSLAQLESASPETKAALDSMLTNDPVRYKQVTSPLLTANSGGKASGYGSEFYPMLRRVLAPNGDPTRIADPHVLTPYVQPGDHAPITNTGFSQISSVLGQRGTPQGEAFAQSFRNFLGVAHTEISGSDPRTGTIDHKGDEQFNKYLGDLMPKINAGLKAGKTPAQLFNPKSPDFVGDSVTNFTRPVNQRVADMYNDATAVAMYGPKPEKPVDPARAQAIDAAVKAGQLPPEKASALKGIMADLANGRINRAEAAKRALAAVPSLAPPPPAPRATF